MDSVVRKFKKGKDTITVTTLSNGLLYCETTNKQYNRVNTDGYWIAAEVDIKSEVEHNGWELIKE